MAENGLNCGINKTSIMPTNITVPDIGDFENLHKIFLKNKIDLIIVGPEKPLVDGIADFFNKKKTFEKGREE